MVRTGADVLQAICDENLSKEGRSSAAFTVSTAMAEYIESNGLPTSSAGEKLTMDIDNENQLGIFRKVTQFLLRWGIETHG